jgi:wee1-like protein kinase
MGTTFPRYPVPDVCLYVGLTMYETGGGGPLPKNGEEWHNIREGKLKELQQYSRDFNDLLKVSYMKGIRQEALHCEIFFFL